MFKGPTLTYAMNKNIKRKLLLQKCMLFLRKEEWRKTENRGRSGKKIIGGTASDTLWVCRI